MGRALFGVLGLFLLNILLYCGHAQDALLHIEPNWSPLFNGEKVTFICDSQEGNIADWVYSFNLNDHWTNYRPENTYTLSSLTTGDSGEYQCAASQKSSNVTRRSNKVSLSVSAKPKAQLRKYSPVAGSVTLTCSVGSSSSSRSSSSSSSGWKYFWYKDDKTSEPLKTGDDVLLQSGSFSHSGGGVYWCRGGRGDPVYYTEYSRPVVTNRADVKPNWPEIYSGETITLTCGIEEGGGSEWEYEWRTPDYYTPPHPRGSMMTSSVRGDYSCKGRLKDGASTTEWSDAFTVKTSAKPKAQLRKYSVGGHVTLTCSVESSSSSSSSGWKYFWYKDDKTSEPLKTGDDVLLQSGSISPSGGGVYWCRGGRGAPVYYTEYSHPVVTNRAVVTLQHDWPEIYSGETITLTCGIEEGGGSEWEYEWRTPDYYTPPNPRESMITSSVRGDYSCKGRLKDGASTTEWSDAFTVKTSDVPQPVLTVSPSWTSPGDSVTLTCSVEPPSAGWRFFWYQAVPELSLNYTYELLVGNTTGTEQDSYILHGQTHTAGYVCRAGRGDPVFYTLYSDVKFVWSGGVNPAASLTVSPHRLQHFSTESLSLSCEGNSTEWKVMKADESGFMSSCSYWGQMTGSTCNTDTRASSGVYWCESATQSSNAANITTHNPEEAASSSVFLLLLVVGLVSGVLLIILLLLILCCYRKSKASSLSRSQRTNQSPATDHMINQGETQDGHYAALLHGDSCLYETIRGSGQCEPGTNDEPEESDYQNVMMETAAGTSSTTDHVVQYE
ncbi:B-cell receptor CD22-like isoform X13 [Gasterosteus aculeatus]